PELPFSLYVTSAPGTKPTTPKKFQSLMGSLQKNSDVWDWLPYFPPMMVIFLISHRLWRIGRNRM
ncbi:TPA: hypothetical protein ACJG01_003720, partial [Salmonella enterica subsp. salamae serovar 21:z10:[z6]]|nr:hypothetical protein [Salmonella enterica]ECC9706310.1 hypothetical protein [Salmonella enterica subsp. salamae]ECG1422569.1 hypothetical protein [Salmonella enterica subsp. salamae str. CFSAN000559]HAE2717876.1 hypothetical protein [Salmonella enterica subsp. salamae serovar 58:d:z6]ECD9411285.1 hypothetical protein [Salmonella enterica subsp. salamae]